MTMHRIHVKCNACSTKSMNSDPLVPPKHVFAPQLITPLFVRPLGIEATVNARYGRVNIKGWRIWDLLYV